MYVKCHEQFEIKYNIIIITSTSASGQASSSSAEQIGSLASLLADVGWNIASASKIAPTAMAVGGSTVETVAAAGQCQGTRSYSTSGKVQTVASTEREDRDIPGAFWDV